MDEFVPSSFADGAVGLFAFSVDLVATAVVVGFDSAPGCCEEVDDVGSDGVAPFVSVVLVGVGDSVVG